MAMTDPMNTSINLPFNASSLFEDEAKEVDKVDRIYQGSGGTNTTTNATANSTLCVYKSELDRAIYPVALPVMIFFCVLSIFLNVLIVASARWCRRPMTPTLYFSISLALADAVASIALATGLIVNSLLPCVFGINVIQPERNCVRLVIELFRLGCILITVKHLLALGVNHWIGIVRPLHYAATMTRRTAWLVIVISWASPILLLFAYFSAHPGQGFLTEDCKTVTIFNKKTFRIIFASLFFAPLLVMSMIYLHIFLIVKNHHQHRLRYQSCQQLRRNIKAVVTTVLILGTYILGWMPGILWFIIVCDDCLIHLDDIKDKKMIVPVQVVINTLIILKAFVNPIIYAARMSDIQNALRKMQYDILSRCCGKCVPEQPPMDPLERGFSKINRSLCESRSLRKSSCGSSSSTRRPGTIPATIHSASSHLNPTSSFNHHHHNSTRNHNGNNNSVTFEMREWRN